jgi:hypothetical protein
MPGAVGNSVTVKSPATGTELTQTIRVTIPPSGVTPILASIEVSLKNKGQCELHMITSIDATVTYVSGPSGNQVQTQGQTLDQSQIQTQSQPSGPVLDNGLNQFRESIAAGMGILNDISVVRFGVSDVNTLTVPQQLQVISDSMNTEIAMIVNNGGTRAGLTPAMIGAALATYWTAQGKTVTANDTTFTTPFNNPWNNSSIAWDLIFLTWYATHDVA